MSVCFPARSVREFKGLMETDPNEVSFIRSMDDWKYHIRNTDSRDHPLHSLDQEDLDEFTNSLVFNNGGLAGAHVGTLQVKLTYRLYERLMESFGMEIGLAKDYAEYECSKPGNCKKLSGNICTSNC